MKIKILDFYANWCAPCRMMSKVIDLVVEKYPDLIIEKINVDEPNELTTKYNIKSIPTLVLINTTTKNELINVGLIGDEKLIELIKEVQS